MTKMTGVPFSAVLKEVQKLLCWPQNAIFEGCRNSLVHSHNDEFYHSDDKPNIYDHWLHALTKFPLWMRKNGIGHGRCRTWSTHRANHPNQFKKKNTDDQHKIYVWNEWSRRKSVINFHFGSIARTCFSLHKNKHI